MTTRTYFARPDAAFGEIGVVQLHDQEGACSVRLELSGGAPLQDPKESWTPNWPTLQVDGVERHYWVEFVAPLRRRPDLRNVAGRDLRHKEVAVITTDDGRRYAFLTEPGLPAEVIEAIPSGRRRAKPVPGVAQDAA